MAADVKTDYPSVDWRMVHQYLKSYPLDKDEIWAANTFTFKMTCSEDKTLV